MPQIDINGLRQKRADKIDRMAVLLQKAVDEGRDMTEAEKQAHTDLESEVKILGGQIEQAEEVQRLKASTAVPVKSEFEVAKPAAQPRKEKPKGADLARIVRALAATKGIPILAAQLVDKEYGPEGQAIAKALAAGDATAGGFLVPDEFSTEIIELLRARAVIRGGQPMVMPMSGSTTIPKLTAGSTATYVGENQNIGSTQPTFGQVRATERKLAAIVPISNDLIRNSSPQADIVVRDDLVASMAVTEDANFIRGQGTGNGPKGLRYWANTGNVTATAGTAIAQVETDLRFLMQALEGNDVAMIRPRWLIAPRSKNYLWTLRDANGNLAFPEVRDGMLWGYPFSVTNNIPTNLGGGTESEVYFVDMADAVIAEAAGIIIDASTEAAYHDGSNVVAAFSQDQTVVRAIARHDFVVRHDRSVGVVTGVTWGV